MKQVLLGVGIVVIVMSIVFAQTDNHAAAPGASKSLADVRRAIAEGNQKWSEGRAKGDCLDPSQIARPELHARWLAVTGLNDLIVRIKSGSA